MFEWYNSIGDAERRKHVNTSVSKRKRDKKARQSKVLDCLMHSGQPPADVLSACGVGSDEFDKWMEDENFLATLSSVVKKLSRAGEPFVLSRLFKLIAADNIQAMRLFFSLREKDKLSAKTAPRADPEIEALRSDIFGEEEI